MNIRPAKLSDVQGMLHVKKQLVFQETSGFSTQGGFLLGSDEQGYRARIAQHMSWVIEDNGIQGFAIILPNAALRASELWSRKEDIRWEIDPEPLEQGNIGYYDQLAVLPGPCRKLAPVLAFVSLLDFIQQDPDFLLSSTVVKPIQNLAAVPYLKYLGGKCVGYLDEVDPIIGQLLSDIWVIKQQDWLHTLNNPPNDSIAQYIQRAKEILSLHKG